MAGGGPAKVGWNSRAKVTKPRVRKRKSTVEFGQRSRDHSPTPKLRGAFGFCCRLFAAAISGHSDCSIAVPAGRGLALFHHAAKLYGDRYHDDREPKGCATIPLG